MKLLFFPFIHRTKASCTTSKLMLYFHDLLEKTSFPSKYNELVERVWTLHECVTHEIDEKAVSTKFKKFEVTAEEFLKQNKFDYVIQELGGFVAPLSLFKACRSIGINHLFIEPVFFNGSLGFIKNSFSYNISSMSVNSSAFNSSGYIDRILIEKTRVVPKKDAHHFSDLTFWKFLNKRNVLSISKKIYYRHFLRMDFEYKYVGVFIRRSIGALFNKLFFRRRYKDIDFLQQNSKQVECFFFPLHVKLDFSLTVRSPKKP